MDPVTVGIIGIVVLVVLFLLRMPVAFAMAFVGVVGFCIIRGPEAGLNMMVLDFWDRWKYINLTVIPMFVFMGSVAYYSGMSGRLYDGAYTIFGRMRGGLVMATVAATAGFSAICGSTSATAAAMGKVAIPEMRRHGYDPGLACGCMAAAGSLGIMIPPSTIFIIYGILTEQSVGKLFVAGVIPGLILAALFMIVVWIWTFFKPTSAPAGGSNTMREKLMGLVGVLEMFSLFLLVILGLSLGWFSPTQAAAVGTAVAILIGVARRQLSWQKLWSAVKDTLQITAMIMTIIAGAYVFGHFMAVTRIPTAASDFFAGLPLPAWAVMSLILVMYLIAGCFMDSLAMVTLTVPILINTIEALGIDKIWFGVIVVLVVEMGVITPPVGMNVYILKGVAPDVPMGKIFKGASLFLLAMIVLAVLLMVFPELATWLPSKVTY